MKEPRQDWDFTVFDLHLDAGETLAVPPLPAPDASVPGAGPLEQAGLQEEQGTKADERH